MSKHLLECGRIQPIKHQTAETFKIYMNILAEEVSNSLINIFVCRIYILSFALTQTELMWVADSLKRHVTRDEMIRISTVTSLFEA